MNGDLSIGSINGGGVSSYNLIINPEFTINQRGAASRTATSSAYNYDRWYYDGTYLYQGIENLSLRNGTYCLSWSGASTAAYSLNSSSSSSQGGESYTAVTNGGTITISGLGSETLWVRFASDLTNLSQVCLRKGTSPLTFEHRNYGEELALCQRYYETCGLGDGGDYEHSRIQANEGMSYIAPPVRYKVTKRAVPSVTVYGINQEANTINLNGTNTAPTAIFQSGINQFNLYKHVGSGTLNYIVEYDWVADAEL